ncbi:SusC/RagA family TonB-linked outer membrane protein [Chondrinema litorale]|uniref:SusC/RagA family TonB-linked outer membrane protein n=1 Tax=Chondrinema litorale TaxID=2994555 RepID=UPI002542E081|nr:TonB-dependent receptor [Chondrinema litorale]UZR99309.1 TonB-dependent receptor [Chondrinema litorale]
MKRLLRFSAFVWCFLMLSNMLAYGQVAVSGTVNDTEDMPLPGVSVIIKGSSTGTVTDIDGNFRLEVKNEDAVLIFSYVGFLSKEIPVGEQITFNIKLDEDVEQLSEVVIVGYGAQKKVNLSGAVDQVDAKQLENRPISNIAQGLQGAVPNLNIDFMSGEPGKAANINIRGLTSINGGNPLILIDGVPSEPIELNRISPQDIESISVLKDASSAAIYGARAAFGIIMITTKTGKGERMQISYSNNFSWDKPTILPNKITDPYIYMRLLETSTDNTPWDNVNYSDESYQWARERSDDPDGTTGVRVNPNDASSWEYMGNRNWADYFMSDYSVSQNHQISLSGSSDKANYFISGNYNKQNGALKLADDYYDRFGVRSKVEYQPYKWLKVGNNTFLSATDRVIPTQMNITSIYNFHPTDWDKNPDGTWANTSVGSMGARLTNGGMSNETYNGLQSRFTAQVSVLQDILKLNADFTFRRGETTLAWDTKKYQIGYGPEDVRETGSNTAYKSSETEEYNVLNIYGTFDKSFGAHHLTAIAGFNQEYYRSEWFYAQRNDVISASLPTIALATGNTLVDEEISDWAIRGAFYRLNYILKDRYIFELNGRYDGSSKFPKDDRFGFFPSASLAWRVDEESFFTPLENVMSTLKLRASYGSLGNQAVGEYGYISSMDAYQAGLLVGGERPVAITPPQLVSSNYSWESVSTFNFGVDAGFLNGKVTANFDIYKRNTKDMLTQGRDLPDVLGAGEPKENAADMETKGWEFSLAYNDQFLVANKPFSFNARFIISDSRSYITRFDNPNGNLTQYYEGMELGEIWGLQSDGLFQSEDEIASLDESSIIPWGALTIVPGWPKYQDLDGNGAIEKGLTTSDPKDLSVIGNISPRYRYGLNLSMNWGQFDASIFLQGVGKRDYYPLDYLYWGFYQQPYAGGAPHLLDFYRATADSEVERAQHSQAYIDAGLADANLDAKYPVLQSWLADRNLGERVDESMGLAIPQTRYMLNAAYLRLKNLTIGYTLPPSLTNKINVGNVRIYVSGENLAEWSEVKDYYDPEAINDNLRYNPSVSTARGTGKGYSYPFLRRYAIGLNVNF